LEKPAPDLAQKALEIVVALNPTEDIAIQVLWDPLVAYFAKTHSEAAFKLLKEKLPLVPIANLAPLVFALLTGLRDAQAEPFLKFAWSIPFARTEAGIDRAFWTGVAALIPQLEFQAVCGLAMFFLKYQKEAEKKLISYEFLAGMLHFLYTQTVAFAAIAPVLQVILNCLAEEEVAIFLVHHQFIEFLHHIAVKYPFEANVGPVLSNFDVAFARFMVDES
jgi:hypothetical protein